MKCFKFYGSAWHKVLDRKERDVTLQLAKSSDHGVDIFVNGMRMPGVTTFHLYPDHPFPQIELRMCLDVLVWDESILSDCNLSEQLREDLERLGEEAEDREAVSLPEQSTDPIPPKRKTCGDCHPSKRQAVWPIVLISIATALATNAVLLWLGL